MKRSRRGGPVGREMNVRQQERRLHRCFGVHAAAVAA
jgi:hypothetical protein